MAMSPHNTMSQGENVQVIVELMRNTDNMDPHACAMACVVWRDKALALAGISPANVKSYCTAGSQQLESDGHIASLLGPFLRHLVYTKEVNGPRGATLSKWFTYSLTRDSWNSTPVNNVPSITPIVYFVVYYVHRVLPNDLPKSKLWDKLYGKDQAALKNLCKALAPHVDNQESQCPPMFCIPCANGLLDVRTYTLTPSTLPHNGIEWDPQADAKKFLELISSIKDVFANCETCDGTEGDLWWYDKVCIFPRMFVVFRFFMIYLTLACVCRCAWEA